MPNRIETAKLRLYGFTQAAAGHMKPDDAATWSALVNDLIAEVVSDTKASMEPAPSTRRSNAP